MITVNNVLLSVQNQDVDENGVLYIPNDVIRVTGGVGTKLCGLRGIVMSDSVREIQSGAFDDNPELEFIDFGNGVKTINSMAFNHCPNVTKITIPYSWPQLNPWFKFAFQKLNTVARRTPDGNICTYPIINCCGQYYFESHRRKIGNITAKKLHKIEFQGNDITPNYSAAVCLANGECFINNKFKFAINDCRVHIILQEFERIIHEYECQHGEIPDQYKLIFRDALKKTYTNVSEYKIPARQKLREYAGGLSHIIQCMDNIIDKYKNAQSTFYELRGINIHDLMNTIGHTATQPRTTQSCTRWLKSRPVSSHEMRAIVAAGYKNPGAFPYSWLIKIPPQDRGKATLQLHDAFKNATIKMYSPDMVEIQQKLHQDTLAELARNVSKIIHQPIKIKYLSSGNFAKTYIVQIPGDTKYVWKIYHCDRTDELMRMYYHDTELQNSFLVGGKKYSGKIKFRNISTAGISNQRGEIYLIYPYTDAKILRDKIFIPFENTRPYSMVDSNYENFRGNTLIDVGALRINYDNLSHPQFVSKIARTILYHSWNDLGYVLNNYSSHQIGMALNFISDRISIYYPDITTIRKKIDFLKQQARINSR